MGIRQHLVPIFGVRGLNNGLADAVNAAWKLAWVLKGEASEKLLESYSPERRGATLEVFANAGKSTRFMTPPSQGYRLMRDAALSLALRNDYASRFADPRQVTPYTYAESSVTAEDDKGFSAGPIPGAPLINRRLGENNFLLDHLGTGFNLLVFSEDGGVTPELQAALVDLQKHYSSLDVLVIARHASPAFFTTLIDHQGACFDGYDASAGSAYLVRPDRHITARWKALNAASLSTAFKTALGEECS